MGANVTRLDYDWADDYHTHSRRRDAILRKYPEIRKLMTYDPVFKWRVLAMVATQCVSFYFLSYVNSFWVLFLCAYFFGGVINHSLTLAIHDISHNQAYGYGRPLANRLFGMVANLPIGFPSSVTFRKYHTDHHLFLGKQADTDVPTEWEGRFFTNSKLKVLWLIMQPFFYATRPLIVSPKPIEKLEVLNLVIQFAFNYLVVRFCGWHVLAYMILGTIVCMGLHPIAGHFLSEHYVFFYEEDYLEKLRVHQKELSEKLLVPDTFSYYGPLNAITFNVGYHVEHHDFPSIPSSLLPKVREIAHEFYEPLCYHTSWSKALFRYIMDPRMNPFARIRRKELFVEFMNGKRASFEAAQKKEKEQQKTDSNGNFANANLLSEYGDDDNDDPTPYVDGNIANGVHHSKQNGHNGHPNGKDKQSNGNGFLRQRRASLSMLDTDNELINKHYIFYE